MVTKAANKPFFRPVKRDRVFEEVSAQIKKQIYRGTLKPGDKLPSETELARSFGVSRQTIREALRTLEISGFITIKRGVKGGPLVENTISNKISESLSDAIQMGTASIDDLTSAWLLFGRVVVEEATEHADASDLEKLRATLRHAEQKLKSNKPIFEESIELYRILASATKNKVFEIIQTSVMAVYADFLSRMEPEPAAARVVLANYEKMVAAISKGKKAQACACFENHVTHIKKRLMDWSRSRARHNHQK
jgi:GntR family transcriptional regulator, transcriptional repressor for pyruvate dehydrogenase complex